MAHVHQVRARLAWDIGSLGGAMVVLLGLASWGFAAQPVTFYGFDAASLSPAAQEGLEEIFSGHCFHGGTPVAAARMMLRAVTAAQKDSGVDPESPEGKFYASGRFPSPPNRASGAEAGFGLGESVFDRDGVPVVNINCFTCHAGVVNGQVVAGLGNNHINQSDPKSLRTRGDNFGPYAVWRLSAQLADPENEGMALAKGKTELQELIESSKLPPVDPMPWWLMKYKTLDYWYGDGGIENAAHFSLNFTTPHAEINARRAEHVKTVAKALAFARETQSPPFPGSLNAELVQQGADLFHGRATPAESKGFLACKTCHGTYARKAAHTDPTQPGGWDVNYRFSHVLRNVKTDASYNEVLKTFRPIADHINKLEVYFAGQGTPELAPQATVPAKDGYVAPPLVGVWASAPYFHNGSVPTIEAVLNSAIRPEIWSRNNRDPLAYDLEHVGMQFKVVSQAEFDASAKAAAGKPFLSPAAVDHGANYDTKEFGHANTGHPFGNNLTHEERLAVIEFLKSLSGPDM